MQEEVFAWTSLLKSFSWTTPLAEGGLQKVPFQTLWEQVSLVEDLSRDQKCMVSLFLFRSNLRGLGDQHVMLYNYKPWTVCNVFAFPVHSQLVCVLIFLLEFDHV